MYETLIWSRNNWFHCRYVQARDAGSYECQVSTVPKIMTVFDLSVVGK